MSFRNLTTLTKMKIVSSLSGLLRINRIRNDITVYGNGKQAEQEKIKQKYKSQP